MKSLRQTLALTVAALLLLVGAASAANTSLTVKAPPGTTPGSVQTRNEGILTPNSNGWITINIPGVGSGGVCAASTVCDQNGADLKALLGAGYVLLSPTIYTGGASAVFSQVAAEAFTSISGNGIATLVAATEGDAMQAVTGIMNCHNLYCSTTNIAGTLTAAGGTSWSIAVDDNTVAQALTCTETATQTHCSDTTHSFQTAVGDMLDFGWTPSGTPTAIVPHCSMECDF
jgi:hypothetical protein